MAIVGGIALCWILLTPPGAGADDQASSCEPAHWPAAISIPTQSRLTARHGFDLPASYALPDPACYAFHPAIPADCAAEPSGSAPTVALRSTADEYPIWGHLPGGLLSRIPGMQPIWWARLGGAAVPAALVGAALWLASPRRPLAAAAILLALTPMAWGVFAVVNPSAMAIGGAVALWAGLLYASGPPSSAMAWLTACGWAALALPRRDGLIWACIALAIALGRAGRTFAQWWRRSASGPKSSSPARRW